MRGHRDLRLACAAAVLCALVAALVPLEIVRLIAALPLALFLPGYAVVAVAFGSRELEQEKQLMLSVAVSLMILVLGTFVLNIFPFGLTTGSWAVLLAVIVIAACRGAALRRARPTAGKKRGSRSRPSLPAVAIGAVALAIAVAAIALAQRPLPADDAVGFTALWMLPTDSSEDAVAVGVVSNQHHRTSYQLEVSPGKSQSQSYRVQLDPGEERVFEIDVPSEADGRTHVVATLYRTLRPGEPYRRVTSWLPRQKTLP